MNKQKLYDFMYRHGIFNINPKGSIRFEVVGDLLDDMREDTLKGVIQVASDMLKDPETLDRDKDDTTAESMRCDSIQPLDLERMAGRPKRKGTAETVKFTIDVEMQERWVPYFLSLLHKMQSDGNIGHSEMLGFYADGDGDFRPRFKTDDSTLAYLARKHKDEAILNKEPHYAKFKYYPEDYNEQDLCFYDAG